MRMWVKREVEMETVREEVEVEEGMEYEEVDTALRWEWYALRSCAAEVHI